jgi:NAD(P)H dehydrogenase (quinone)
MKVLMVYAHPEPASFGAALRDAGVHALEQEGHSVEVSDLYAMDFNPVARASDFKTRRFPNQLQYDREQKHASAQAGFVDDIQAEIDKLLWCDVLILQFPLWWFSVPAIMKGWLDRVLVNGICYGAGRRLENGGLSGRKAMVAMTTGCYEAMMASDGMLGDLQNILWPIQFGAFTYTGLQVLPPWVGWGIQYTTPEHREGYLASYAEHLRALDRHEPLFFHPQAHFGKDWKLLPDIEPKTSAQRRVVV